jgi:triosephosphate isomerase
MKFVVGNYKMQLTSRETSALVRGVLHGLNPVVVLPEIIICPSFTALPDVQKLIKKTPLNLGAQNVAATPLGAYTGEVAAAQLADIGCTYTIIGHSERRAVGGTPPFAKGGETDAQVHAKITEALAAGLTPIICVGESAAERAAGQTDAVITHQITSAITGISFPRKTPCIIAYEPIWAISTNEQPQLATIHDIVEAHSLIRRLLVGLGLAIDDIAVLYGGSVDALNAQEILSNPEVDGVLVGSASLKIHEFSAIIEAAITAMKVISV